MTTYRVIWKKQDVGQLTNPVPERWNLEGDWKSNETAHAQAFEKLVTSPASPAKLGLEITLREGKDKKSDIDATTVFLDHETLFASRNRDIKPTIKETFFRRILRILNIAKN